jgi:O-antigen/teichoic acid export membrane protein
MDRIKQEWAKISKSDLARNAGWLFFGRGLSVALQGVYLVLVGRLLGSVEYGTYVGALAMVAILSQYSSLGTPELFFRYVGVDPKKFSIYWGMVLAITFALGTLFVGILAIFGPHFAPNISRTMLICVAVGECLGTQLTASTARIFLAFEKVRYTVITSLLVNLLRTILAGVIMVRWHHGTAQQWAVAALVVSSIASAYSVILVTRLYGKPVFSIALLRQRMGEGFVFALSNSTANAYNDIDKAMLGHYGMDAANGIYTMAYRVIDVCTAPISSIHAAAFPRFFRKGVDGVRSTAAYGLQIVKRTAPLALLFTGAMLLGGPILPHLVGKDFAESVIALRWLCLLPLFRSLQLAAGDGVTGAGYQNLRLCGMAGAAAFNFGVNLYLIPHYSWRGAAWSSIATDGLLALFNWLLLGWLLARDGRRKAGLASFPAAGTLNNQAIEVAEAESHVN